MSSKQSMSNCSNTTDTQQQQQIHRYIDTQIRRYLCTDKRLLHLQFRLIICGNCHLTICSALLTFLYCYCCCFGCLAHCIRIFFTRCLHVLLPAHSFSICLSLAALRNCSAIYQSWPGQKLNFNCRRKVNEKSESKVNSN